MKPYNELSDEEKLKVFTTATPTSEQINAWEELRIMFEPGIWKEEPAESLARCSITADGLNAESEASLSSITKPVKGDLKIGEKYIKVLQWEGEKAAEKAIDELLQEFADTAMNQNDKDVIESAVFETQRRRGKLGPEGITKLEELHKSTSAHEADAQRESALKQIRRKIAKTPKFRAIIYNGIVSYLTKKPSTTNREIWESFPDGKENAQTIGDDVGHSAFRDGEFIYQVDSHGKADKLRSIGPRSFDRYVRKTRDELKIPTLQKKRRQ